MVLNIWGLAKVRVRIRPRGRSTRETIRKGHFDLDVLVSSLDLHLDLVVRLAIADLADECFVISDIFTIHLNNDIARFKPALFGRSSFGDGCQRCTTTAGIFALDTHVDVALSRGLKTTATSHPSFENHRQFELLFATLDLQLNFVSLSLLLYFFAKCLKWSGSLSVDLGDQIADFDTSLG